MAHLPLRANAVSTPAPASPASDFPKSLVQSPPELNPTVRGEAPLANLELSTQMVDAPELEPAPPMLAQDVVLAHAAARKALARFGNYVFDPDEVQTLLLGIGDLFNGKQVGTAATYKNNQANQLRNFLFTELAESPDKSSNLETTGPYFNETLELACLSYVAQSFYSRTDPVKNQVVEDLLGKLESPTDKALLVKIFIQRGLDDKGLHELTLNTALGLLPSLLVAPFPAAKLPKYQQPWLSGEDLNAPPPINNYLKQENLAKKELLKRPGDGISLGLSGWRATSFDPSLRADVEYLGHFTKRTKTLNFMCWDIFVRPTMESGFFGLFHAAAEKSAFIRFSLSGFSQGTNVITKSRGILWTDLQRGGSVNEAVRRGLRAGNEPISSHSTITEWELATVLKNDAFRAKTVFEVGSHQIRGETFLNLLTKADPELARLLAR